MNSVTIRKEIKIAAPASQVWRYIGTASGLRQWWGVEVTMEERTGGHCEEAGIENGRSYRLVGKVTIYDPPHRLALTMQRRSDHDGSPLRTELEITLAEEAAQTTVALVHRAFTAIAAVGAAVATDGTGHGPLMALPGYQGAALLAPPTPSVLLTAWQQRQAVQWQRRCVALSSLELSIIQQEAISA